MFLVVHLEMDTKKYKAWEQAETGVKGNYVPLLKVSGWNFNWFKVSPGLDGQF